MNATTNATRDARHGRARSRRLPPLLAVSLVAALAVFVGSGSWSAAPPAAAQTATTLIANSGQAEAAAGAVLTNDHAQAFTTGSNADGYTLTRVDLEIAHDSTAPTYDVSIHAASGGNPGARLGSLTKSSAGSSGTIEFTTDGIDLDAETTYFVLIAGDAGNSGDTVSRTPSKAEDTGGASGWSIADDRRWRSAGSSSAWTTHSTDVLQIAIHGSEQTADNTTPEAAQSTPRSTSNSPVSGTQDTTPTLPSACGADGTDNASIKAVASTSTTITVTFTGLTNPSYAGNLRICEPDSSDVYSARIVNSFAIGSQPVEDDTHDITGLTADTDYWVEYRYSSLNQWHYIRTAVAEPDLPAGCTGAGTDTSLLSAVASTATTVTVTFGSGITIDPGSGSTDVIICEPGTGDAYSTRTAKHFPNNMDPAAGSTFEISGLSAATDYWVRVNFYGGGGPWHYIRTTAASSSDPTITIAAGTSPVTEGTAAEFTVTADSAPSADLTVNLTVADATGSDFVAATDEGSKTVTITANTTTATHSVPTTADTTDEPDGDVSVTVETGTGYTVGATASANVTVNDDDGPPVLVSNSGQADSFDFAFNEHLAVPFTTGTTNSSGYTLASVAMTFGFDSPGGSTPQGFTVDIRTGSGASVGSSVGSLTSPSLTAGTNTFSSAEGIHLDAGTSYFVVFDLSGSLSTRGPKYKTTVSDNEDSGAAAGWTIGDRLTVRSLASGSSWRLATTSNVAEITIRGATAPPQTTPTEGALVANHGQNDAAYANFGNDLAQAFTTGGNTTGYKLTSIEVVGKSTGGTAPSYTVAIHEDSSGEPGAKVTNGDLSAPALESTDAVIRFGAAGSGIELAANTRYWLFIDNSTSTPSATIKRTDSTAEDAGAVHGWSIADTRLFRPFGATSWSMETQNLYEVGIHGSANADSAMPTFSSATVDGAALTITFDEHIDPTSVPAPGDFEVQVAGSARSVDSGGVAIAADTVTLTLSSAVAAGETVTVAYTKPGSNPLQDYARNDVASFAAQTVTNDTVRLPIITIAPAATLASLSAVDEGTAAVFTVTADFAPTADLTVNLTVADAAGSDFVAETDQFAKTVTITANTKTADHSVPTTNDTIDEPDGDVLVTVEPHADYVVGDPSSASVRVFDGDVPADTLVSNNEQTPRADAPIGFTSSGFESFAAAFSTGSPGAVISAVDLRLGADGVGSEAALVVSLYSTTAAGAPDASLFVFDNPVGFAANTVNTFTVPTDAGSSATLAANTTYAIVLETASTAQNENNQVDFAFTREDGEDSGAAAGWSIADASHSKIGSGNWSALSTGFTATIGVRGTLLDAAAPTFGSAKVDGARLVIVFSEDLDPDSVPAPGAFDVQVASSARTVADGGVDVSGSAVTLTLSSAVTAGETVTVAYSKPSDDPLQDLSGNPVATFTAQSVTVRLANAPEGLEVEAANNLDLIVRWEAPASLPTAHAVTGYTVEWTPAGGSATTADVDSDTGSHHIKGLTEGAAYTARVSAAITNSTDPTNPVDTTVWSVTSPPVTIWQEPIQGWFTRETPFTNLSQGRTYMMVDTNMIGSKAHCLISGSGGINCPPRTLVSLPSTTSAEHFFEISVTFTAGANSSTTTTAGQTKGPALALMGEGGLNVGTVARASGGNGRLVVGWTRVSSSGALGNVDAVVVETRRQNNDGTWPDWTQTVIPGAHAEVQEGSYAFNGLDNGTYQVRVRGRADGDDGDANTTDIPRLGFTTRVQTVTVAAANTNRPGSPTAVRVTGSGTSRTVTWEPPADATAGAVVYGYQVRHRVQGSGDDAWTESDELYPRQIRRYCSDDSRTCANPRSYTISGLTNGTNYDVEVVALNANSALADDMTAPSFSAAAVNEAALTVSFDEALDPNSAPAPGDFTVTVGTDRRDVAPDGVAIRGATVTLTLESAVLAADTVKVAYTAGANPLRDPATNAVATFGDQSVLNTTGSAVSNAGQPDDEVRNTTADYGQAFTTGSHPGGYTLSRVDLAMSKSGTDVPTYSSVGIHKDASNLPGASVGTLSNPSGVTATRGFVALNASGAGIALEPNTTYWLVIDISGGSTVDQTIGSTTLDTEDPGAAKGWSIADGLLTRGILATDWSSPLTGSDALQIAVHAAPNPTTVLVGNFGQPDGGVSAGTLTRDYAQAFTTGAADNGWTLTRLDLEMALTSGDTAQTYTLKIHADLASAPGSEVGTLANPTGITSTLATRSFTTEGLELAAETTYWVVLDVTNSPSDPGLEFARTAGKGEDAGAPDGWTIANSSLHRALAATAWNTDTTRVLKIAIHGSEVTAQKLVGNTETGAPEQDASFTVDNAISFTTGSNGAGYELTSVGLRLKSSASTAPVYSVRIEGDANSLPDGISLGALTTSSSLSSSYALIEFAASGDGLDLAAGTTYWVVLDVSAGGNDSHVAVVVTRNEDAGGAAGWSIGDASYFRMQDDSNQWSTTQGSHPTALAVYGNIKPDTTEPEFVSAAVDGATLTVTFNEDLDTTSAPAPGDFTVTVGADRRDVAAGGVAIAGDTVTLTLSSPVLAVDTVLVRYTAGANPLRDAAANAVADFGDQMVQNETTPDTTEPAFSSAAVNGTTLTLTFNEALDTTSVPLRGAFHVTVGSIRRNVSTGGVSIDGVTVTLRLTSAVQYGATVRVRYSRPSSGPLQDHSGNAVASFGNQTVTNDTPDTTNPTFSSAVVDRATLTVTFSKDLDSVSVPVPGDFTVKVNEGTRGVAADGVVIDGKTVTLTLESAVSGGQIVTVAYTAGTPPLQDRSVTPNAVETFGDQPVTNETVPWLPDDVVVSGVKLTLIYDQDLDDASVPNAGDFVVSVGGTVWQLVEPADALSDGVNPPKVPTVLLVGNTAFVAPGQDGNQVELTHADDIAQSFTTGSHPDGYTLRSVEAFMKNEGTPAPSYTAVGIHADSSGAPGAPGASVGTLTKQGSPGSDRSKVRFTSSDAGIALEPNTTYWFVLDLSAAFNDVKLFATTAKTERSDTGSLTDWSLGDGHRSRSPASSVWNQTDNDNVIQIDIRGHVAITPVAVRDSRVILTLHPDAGDLVAKGGRVTLSYTAGTDPVRGADGTEAASFADRSVKNLASDRTAPTLRAVTVDTTGGPTDKLILTYNERLDPDSVPAPGTFLVQVGTNRVAVTNVEVSGRQVTLKLAAAVPEGEYVGVNFPTSAAIQDYAGNPAAPVHLERAEHGPPPADTPSSSGGTPSGGGFVGGGGGGGAGPSGPSTSTVDFEWNVKRDIDALDSGHDNPTGLWGDGETLLLLENGGGADDAVYAYDAASGERAEGREFRLDRLNRAPRGVASSGGVVWVADSGRDRLYAYDADSGERLEERDIALARGNRDPRGIWADGETIWVLNRNPSLYAYHAESGDLLGVYALAGANGDPRGLWSDGVTLWVSDHGRKQLFAYRLPALPEAEPPEEPPALERVRDEDFEEPGRVGNNSPRGIWSDGAVMYVADAHDDRVYSYNMPDAIDARLASLTLAGVEFGEFSPARREYEGGAETGVEEATVTAAAVQRGTDIVIAPADADGDPANGHQVALEGLDEITVTVTSADGSRTRVYRVALASPEEQPWGHSLKGAVAEGFSLLVYEGGSVEALAAAAESRGIAALYVLHEGRYVAYFPEAPDFVNRPFADLFADGVPALTPLVAASEGPPSEDPVGELAAPGGWPACLHGEVGAGWSLVLHEGGSVEELAACAESRGVTALYVLHEGEWVSYILGAPDFVNRAFAELYADGLCPLTPLVVRSDRAQADGEGGNGGEN